MGDVNLHLDVPIDASTSSFSSLLAANNLAQVVQSPTYTAGHLLDVVIVGSDTSVTSVNVPPPVLSDHSMIDVTPVVHGGLSATTTSSAIFSN